jgi:hypothetical protein
VFVSSSHGGQTFGEAVPLPLFGVSNVAMSAGAGTMAYLAASSNKGTAFVRTIDGGASWQEPRFLTDSSEGFSLVFSSNHAVLVARSPNAGSSSLFQNATDGDGAFALDNGPGAGSQLIDDANSGDIWGVSGAGALWRSADNGSEWILTGRMTPWPDPTLDVFSLGGNVMWGVGTKDTLFTFPFKGNRGLISPIPLRSGLLFSRRLASDKTGGVSLFEGLDDLSLLVRHFNADGVEDQKQRFLSANAGSTSVRYLGDKSVGYTFVSGRAQRFGIVAW